MKNHLLHLLENDARLTPKQLSVLLDVPENEIEKEIEKLEAEGVVLSYRTIINWEKMGKESVRALIELKTIPQRDRGFDCIAERISNYPEVSSVYLMSGAYDLALTVECKTMRDVAVFVAEKLATIEGVTSTSTHFVMEKYKENDVIYDNNSTDKRGNIW